MDSAILVDELLKVFYYCDLADRVFTLFKSDFESMVRRYLGVPDTVPLTKKFSVQNKNPLDYIPSFDYEDASFPLDLLLKEQFERVFGEDLSMVKIHTGEYSNDIASRHGAKAVTMGNSIYFARGMYNPYSEEGIALLAHEIQHVVQHNDKDTFFLYDEDIAAAEYMAETIEKKLEGKGLHNINSPVTDGQYNVEGQTESNTSDPDKVEIGNSSNLDDFSSNSGEITYNVTTRDGKVYNITNKEREQLVGQVSEKVQNYISEQYNMLSDDERERYLIKVLQYVQQ